jgi:type 1 glutamine amidotransferase
MEATEFEPDRSALAVKQKPSRFPVAGLLFACLSLAADAAQPGNSGDRLRVLILSGRGAHDWRSTTAALRQILADTDRFDVRVCEAPAGLTARTLADFDVLVDDSGAPGVGSESEHAISSFVSSGKGLVVTHGALGSLSSTYPPNGNSQPAGPETTRSVPEYWPASASSAKAASRRFLPVKIARAENPIARGAPGEFVTADVLYRGLALHPNAEVIASVFDDPGIGGSGKNEPVLFTYSYGKGRVFCCALGHDPAAMQELGFIATFARGTEWAAAGSVSLPTDTGASRRNPDAVRGLLITGGHDHETSFYGLFDGYNDLPHVPVAASKTAFQNDLRGKFDVLIMYDFSRDLDETGKKNLRAFVEGGKGIVVLHHALLDYQDWPWWYEDVVGGSYRLKREGDIPSSTVKDREQLFVTPAEEHPVTAGIGPFHIVDETYKRMLFSPRVRPLLLTNNPNSDRSLAWIGPCSTSRVVAIQLGHGPTAFHHPAYRALVHNAILWSAGRIK